MGLVVTSRSETVAESARRVSRRLIKLIFVAVALVTTTDKALAGAPKFKFPADGIASYVGTLTEADVDGFISAAREKNIRHLLITSPGGTILAGVKLGRWVWTHGVEVVVDRLCMSSCANYVFPAGRGKIIRPDSLVVWHGGAEQKDFRELRERMARIVKAKSDGAKLPDEDEKFHADHAAHAGLWDVQTQAQRDLFAQLGVDEYITRLGQEPVFYGAPWTATIATMKLFGIQGILADDKYGTHDYVAAAAQKMGLKTAPILLEAGRNNSGIEIKVLTH